jgi:peptidoglycan/xylan/chitin deacetylase (PgdA/CDA1 family)
MASVELFEGNTGVQRMPDDFRWPGGRKITVLLGVAYEAWSDGKAPGIGPMGNPLPAGFVDTNALAWAEYGSRRGMDRLLSVLERRQRRATVMINGVLAERAPDVVRRIAAAGHDIAAHSWGMDLMPTMLDETQERDNLVRTTQALASVIGHAPTGWISPRGTPSVRTARLLANAGYSWQLDLLDDDLPAVLQFGGRDLVEIPAGMHINDLPFHIRYGHPAHELTATFEHTLEAFRALPLALTMDVIVHAHVFGRPGGAAVFDALLGRLNAMDDVWVATASDIADHVRHWNASRARDQA